MLATTKKEVRVEDRTFSLCIELEYFLKNIKNISQDLQVSIEDFFITQFSFSYRFLVSKDYNGLYSIISQIVLVYV